MSRNLNPRNTLTGQFLPKLEQKVDRKTYAREWARNYRKTHPEQRKKATLRAKAWIVANSNRHREWASKSLWNLRVQAIQRLGGQCYRCLESDIRLLQINHVNGNGNAERKKVPIRDFYKGIVNGTRLITDLNVLCANHNLLYEYECGRRKMWSNEPLKVGQSIPERISQPEFHLSRESARIHVVP